MINKTKIGLLLAVILVMGCILAGCAAKPDSITPNKGESYFVYIGLNDADTGEQELTKDEAIEVIQKALEDKAQGATVLPAWGSYVGNDAKVHGNDTVLVILNADQDTVTSLIDQWKTALNVGTIYLEKYQTEYEIFGGQM